MLINTTLCTRNGRFYEARTSNGFDIVYEDGSLGYQIGVSIVKEITRTQYYVSKFKSLFKEQ